MDPTTIAVIVMRVRRCGVDTAVSVSVLAIITP
jgi:hypothetical protein